MEKGFMIVVEGSCDGSGKSTQYAKLMDSLTKMGYSVFSHKFPSYGEPSGALVEEYLNGKFGLTGKLNPYIINSFYAADRGCVWANKLKKIYEEGNILLLDRYTTSSLIYQSAVIEDKEERWKFIEFVNDYEYNKIGIAKPDMVIFLHVPFDVAAELRSKRKNNDGVSNDIHERDLVYMRKVYNNSCEIADRLNWDIIECTENNEMKLREEIHVEVLHKVLAKIKK